MVMGTAMVMGNVLINKFFRWNIIVCAEYGTNEIIKKITHDLNTSVEIKFLGDM